MEIVAGGTDESATAGLERWLTEHRDPLIRRWLALVVERSTVEELGERPLGERIRELDLLLEAARATAAAPDPAARDDAPLVEEIELRARAGGPFAVVLFGLPTGTVAPPAAAWRRALRSAVAAEDRVVGTSETVAAVVLTVADPSEARTAADRARARAWEILGGRTALPDVGIALFPDDGADALRLIESARVRLSGREPSAPAAGDRLSAPGDPRPAAPDAGDRRSDAGDRWVPAPSRSAGLPPLESAPPATGGEEEEREETLRQALERWAETERLRAAADEAGDDEDDDGGSGVRPPSPVTPLRPL